MRISDWSSDVCSSDLAQIPVLAERFGNALKVGKADALKMAREDRKAAREADYPFRAHSLETRWTVAADTPRFLALRSESYVYNGGAHGMTGYEALLWDKSRKRETEVTALLNYDRTRGGWEKSVEVGV